ncbi:hypothetical protein J5N97_025344 [Dioscorea zingiberensis]|uniref:Uncharacterized protein n=1 Tax=Dioscorea zingiberensis TaxID=325984 RepID=A0A9D5C9G0_9LILI|nr:hypothetical protein J5N97_025344 [Dioscorea zingiberensis]
MKLHERATVDWESGTSLLGIDLQKTPNIAHTIAIIDMKCITDVCVCRLMGAVYGTRNLYKLDLRGCGNITNRSIIAIVQAVGDTVKWLGLASCTEVSSQGLGILGEGCSRLDHLDLSWCKVDDWALLQISNANEFNLKTIILMGCTKITDDGLASLQLLRWTLLTVNITGCIHLTRPGIDYLRSLLIWGHIVCG